MSAFVSGILGPEGKMQNISQQFYRYVLKLDVGVVEFIHNTISKSYILCKIFA